MKFSIIAVLAAAGLAAAAPQTRANGGFVKMAPTQAAATPATPTSAAPTDTPTCSPGPVINYTVVSNDTLTVISQKLKSGICNIAIANHLANPNFIELGQVLKVPTNPCVIDNTSCLAKPGPQNACATGVPPKYTIVKGDTFFIVAQRLGLAVDKLMAANPGVDPLLLEVGQVINIPICK